MVLPAAPMFFCGTRGKLAQEKEGVIHGACKNKREVQCWGQGRRYAVVAEVRRRWCAYVERGVQAESHTVAPTVQFPRRGRWVLTSTSKAAGQRWRDKNISVVATNRNVHLSYSHCPRNPPLMKISTTFAALEKLSCSTFGISEYFRQ